MKELNRNKLGDLLSKLRRSRDLSFEEMGELLHVSGRTIRRWEKGEILPTMEDVIIICNEFNISLEEIYEGEINLEREVNRKLSGVNSSIETIGQKIVSTDETVSNISNDINDLKDQFMLLHEENENNQSNVDWKEELIWLWLLIVHLMATTMGFVCYGMGRIGHIKTLISSIIYVVVIYYLIYKSKNNMKCQRMLLLYAVFLEVNFLLNYVLFADMPVETPAVINNIELLAINGGMYGFCIFDYYHTEPLLCICIIVYTTWILLNGYHVIKNSIRKGNK